LTLKQIIEDAKKNQKLKRCFCLKNVSFLKLYRKFIVFLHSILRILLI